MNKLIKGKSLAEKVYDVLCDQIRGMRPGDNRLPSEDELSRTLGVSRPTIREALKRLLMNGIVSTYHGKGTYAHPSVFSAHGRMDLNGNFEQMLAEQYSDVEVIPEPPCFQPPTALFLQHFGPYSGDIYACSWLYRANQLPMLYCNYEVNPDFFTENVKFDQKVTSLPQISALYLRAPIDYCTMVPQIADTASIQSKLQLDGPSHILCWAEQIYDLHDNLVAVGRVYVHPVNMELSVVAHFSN